ncbi:GntR family transcriptional regulator [Nocardioides mangrovi]|uniref:GntR family transcriptional regulator n=1 Tax=Nocardioides mangrovi TaxID=2874580 RepID=A0ABS7UEV1_9ACTN|nr:GntR family transcriptional regulator [Nocardioides mangrovi]MBZ5739540.1 GntR family transcriptional regulator [Nocardioides mangrovi]
MVERAEQVAADQDRTEELVRLLRLEERREPAVAQVATWIGLGIVEGRLTPGQDLNSVDLAQRFSSSRTPVREALMLLESEGLVEIRARKRPRVASFTAERVREIYFVRRHLLALVGGLVAERVSDTDLVDLRQRLARMEEYAAAGDVDGYFWGHVDLQSRYVEIAGNEILGDMLDTLALRTLVLRRASLAHAGRLGASVADQVRILDAIEARDGELTSMLLSRATDAALAAIDLSRLTPTA